VATKERVQQYIDHGKDMIEIVVIHAEKDIGAQRGVKLGRAEITEQVGTIKQVDRLGT